MNHQIFLVPDALSDRTASLVEPFTVATRAAKRALPQPGETAIVLGAGTIGIGAALALRYLGCSKIMIVDLVDFRLNIAASLGFETCNSTREDLKAKAIAIFGTAPSMSGPTADVDIFIDAAGDTPLVDTYKSIGKIFSRMVIVAVYAEPAPLDLASLVFSSHSLIGSGGYLPEDVKTVFAILEQEGSSLGAIVTHEFPLTEIVEALEAASDRSTALHVSIVYPPQPLGLRAAPPALPPPDRWARN